MKCLILFSFMRLHKNIHYIWLYLTAGIPKCCINTKSDIRPRILMNVQRWEMQESNSACDIQALVLYVKNFKKPVCAHPNVKPKLKTILKIKDLMARRRPS
uniref:C-C motif chemokine n=1 Tax=Astatotilapia calliptera TaxID=8154 RepID=A0AAX7USY2_ASTCA